MSAGVFEALTAVGGYVVLLTGRHRVVYASPAWIEWLPVDDAGRLVQEELTSLADAARLAGEPVTRAWRTASLGAMHHVLARASLLERRVLVSVFDRTAEAEAIQARRDVVANLGHELRTPVTSIGLIAHVLQSCPDDTATVIHFADRLAGVARRMSELTDTMITLAVTRDDASDTREILDMADVVGQATRACTEAAHSAGVKLVAKTKAGLMVLGHADALEVALENLISNAVAYSRRHGVVRVAMQAVPWDHSVAVSVTDQGIGIDQSDQPRIFERFYRTDEARSRRAGGAGLGLAIVKNTVQAHGGSVSVDSRLGEGSIFRMVLPLADPAEGDAEP